MMKKLKLQSNSSALLYIQLLKITVLVILYFLVSMFSLSAQTPRKNNGADGLLSRSAVKKLNLLIALCSLCFPTMLKAQFYTPDSSSLYVGDKVPEHFYTKKYKLFDLKSKAESIGDLSADRDKLIVLDFWANWCKPCLYYLMKMDSISKELDPSKVKIIPVTYQSSKDLIKIAERFGWNYRSITEDTVLAKMFPHQSLPHMIWIYKGKVVAKPKSDYVSKENIALILHEDMPKMVQNNAIKAVDPNKPLFTANNGKADLLVDQKGFKMAGFVDQYFTVPLTIYRGRDSMLIYSINNPLDQLIYQAFRQDVFQLFDITSAFQWNVSPSILQKQSFHEPVPSYQGDYAHDLKVKDWMLYNYYSYALQLPASHTDADAMHLLQQRLQKAILAHFGLKVELVRGPRKRYAALQRNRPLSVVKQLLRQPLSAKQSADTVQAKVAFFDQPHFQLFVSAPLRNMKQLELDENAVINETDIPKDFIASFAFPKSMRQATELQSVQQELKRYGMKIVIMDRKVPMLRVSEVKKINR
ncbi:MULTISPECIES: TlpA family protein disulfide reductase [Sphingobacterium]|uniref:TlpA family protein disulfide reductase n=1 Tax=Sphingobacterium TaxID=28453 RepID=UPI00257C2775|nr:MULTISPECIES: TlpA disulfide reductase family protein [Sphingobacterium]